MKYILEFTRTLVIPSVVLYLMFAVFNRDFNIENWDFWSGIIFTIGVAATCILYIQDRIPKKEVVDEMDQLSELGWMSHFDNHCTYYKKIGENKVLVNRHRTDEKWKVIIYDTAVNCADEIYVNEDASLEWVLSFTKLLQEGHRG